MSKITLNTVASGFLSNEALTVNFTAIEDALNNKVLYRNNPVGEPNVMQQDLDMNGHYVLNQLGQGAANFIWKGEWASGVSYKQNNLVFVTSGSWMGYTMIALVDHTSTGIFATEYSNLRWAILSIPGRGITWKFNWLPFQPYEVNDAVYITSGTYTGYSMICLTAHTSPASFTISNWGILAKAGDAGVGSGDMLKTDNLAGMASQSTSRANILAARSGANTDITSLASPDIGSATAVTQIISDNSTKVATTAWAKAYSDSLVGIGVPPGMVSFFAGGSPPVGYLECNGAYVDTLTYPALYAVLGTTYGPLVGSTFKLPDLRGEFIRGWDHARGVDVGRVFGSFQNGTAVADQVYQEVTLFIDNGELNYVKGTYNSAPGAAGATRTIRMYYTKPRNLALLPIIKY